MNRIYLAGPISGLTYDEATDWREQVKMQLGPNVECRSPMRAKEYLSEIKGQLKDHYEGDGFLYSTKKFIVTRDVNDVFQSDLVLINFLGATKLSGGTFIEIGLARAWNKPIISIIDKGNPNEHAMADFMTLQVLTVDEGIRLARTILNLGGQTAQSVV